MTFEPVSLSIVLPSGDLSLVVAAPIPDEAPDRTKEALARRQIVAAGGVCPCGARVQLPNRAERRRARRRGGAIHVEVWHASDCPASDPGCTSSRSRRAQ